MSPNYGPDSSPKPATSPFQFIDDFEKYETPDEDQDRAADWSTFDPFEENTGTTTNIMLPEPPEQKEKGKPAVEPAVELEPKPIAPPSDKPAENTIPKILEVREVTAISDKPILLESLPKEKQDEIRTVMVLQGTLMNYLGEPQFCPSSGDRETFLKQLRDETCRWKLNEKGQMVIEKLPEIGKTTKEGYERLVNFLTAPNGAIMRRLDLMDNLQLHAKPGMAFTLLGRDIGILKNRAQIKQEIAEGKATLGIDGKDFSFDSLSKALEKITEVKSVLGEVDLAAHDEIIERKEVILSRMLERQIAAGAYPESWRRPKDMNKEEWCSAIEQTMNTYKRFSKIVDAIALVQKAEVGWKTDAFDNFPKVGEGKNGITLETPDREGRRNISFGDFMMQDLSMLSAANSPKLAELNAWCDRYEADGKKALAELFRAGRKRADGLNPLPHDAIGYGICEIDKGFIDKKLGAWTKGDRPATGEDWEEFNLLTYDMKIQTELDVFGKPSKILITPNCTFYKVPPVLGYCNFIKFPVHNELGSKPLEYKPKDYVAVQSGPDKCEMMHADEVADWKALNQLKDFACTATVVVMDGAMIASGGMAMLGARQLWRIGTEQAVAQGAKYLSTKAVTNIPAAMAKEMLTRQVAKGGFEFGLGVLGPVTHGAGSHEIPVLKTVGDLRTAYFFLQGVTSIASIVKLPQLAKTTFQAVAPKLAAQAENVASFVRGSKEVTEAMRLAETGAFHSMGQGWLGAERAIQTAFSWSETAMVIETIVDIAHTVHESQKHPEVDAKLRAQRLIAEADLLDTKEIQKRMENPEFAHALLQMRLLDYKKSLGPLTKEEAANIDSVIKSVSEITKPGVSAEKRQEFLNESLKYFRYSENQIKEIRRKSTEAYIADAKPRNTLATNPTLVEDIKKYEPYSVDEYDNFGKRDDSRVDPKVRKMASMGALIVWQVLEADKQKAAAAEKIAPKKDEITHTENSASNTTSDVIAKREIKTGEFAVELPAPEGERNKKSTIIVKEAFPITQEITLKELYDLVVMDLNRDPDIKSRVGKAAVMAESGLITREHQASLLFALIDGSDPKISKQDKVNAVVALGRVINKISLQEMARTKQLSEQDQYVAKGIAAGLSSSALKAKLIKVADQLDDKDLKATIQFTLDFLNTKRIDEVNQKRYNDAFLNNNTGITDADYQKQIQSDFASQPKDAGGWERKLIATIHLLDDVTDDRELALKIFKSFKDCAEKCPFTEIKIRAVEALLKPSTASGAARIDSLSEKIQGFGEFGQSKDNQNSKKDFVMMTLMLFETAGIKDSAKASLVERKMAAEARADLINILTPYVNSAELPGSIRLGFESQLNSMVKDGNPNWDWSSEARTAAVKALGSLQFGSKRDLDVIKRLLNPKLEPSPAVRLAAIETFEKKVLNTSEIKDFLGPLAIKEPDFAVQERLSRYYTPSGNLGDGTSQASKQETSDKTANQNKAQVTGVEVQEFLKKEYPCLLKSNSLFDYMDTSKKFYVYAPGHKAHLGRDFFKPYNGYIDLPYKDWWESERERKDSDMMIRLEAVASVEGIKRYNDKVDELATKASGNGSETVTLGKGVTANTVNERKAAIYALGYLLQNGPQMGEEFYKHRPTWDDNVPKEGPGSKYIEFTPAQQKLRHSVITSGMFLKQLDLTDYKKNGITPATSEKCWTDMELRIANHFKNLATESRDLPLLEKQILDSLRSDKLQNDNAKAVLVEALDKLVSRSNIAPEAVVDAVNAISDIVGSAQEGKIENVDLKSASLNAMIAFLNKHAVKKSATDTGSAFEPFSKEANSVRTSINSRMSMQNTTSPSSTKLRANDMYEQQWQSVLSVFDRRAPLHNLRTKEKIDLLPKEFSMLEKNTLEKLRAEESSTCIDGVVDSNVQKIVDATNGDTIPDNDPRIEALTELTSEKYHDRIRLAAAIALLNGRKNSCGAAVLGQIATDCEIPSLRNDAMRALERADVKTVVSDSMALYSKSRNNLVNQIEKALQCAGVEKKNGLLDNQALQNKSDAELIQLANDFITDTGNDVSAERKNASKELKIKLYEYGATIANVGTMHLKAGKENAPQAERNLKNALAAFGVSDIKIAELRRSEPSYNFERKFFEQSEEQRANKDNPMRKFVKQLCDKIAEVEIFEDKNSTSGQLDLRSSHVSSLVRALNSYSQLSANMMKDSSNHDLLRLEDMVTTLSLSGMITEEAYLPGSGFKAESYQQIAKAFRTLAESNRVIKQTSTSTTSSGKTKETVRTIPLDTKSYESMMKYLEKAESEYMIMGANNLSSSRSLSGSIAVRNEMINARVQQIKTDTRREMAKVQPAAWTLTDIEKMSLSVEKLMTDHPDKNQLQPHLDLVQLNMSCADRQTDQAKKLEAQEKARAIVLDAIKLSLIHFKSSSTEFKNACHSLISLSLSANKPEWCESFFKRGIEAAESSKDTRLKSDLLAQQFKFLINFGRKEEAESVKKQWLELTKPTKSTATAVKSGR